jgi:hypothetical protein
MYDYEVHCHIQITFNVSSYSIKNSKIESLWIFQKKISIGIFLVFYFTKAHVRKWKFSISKIAFLST